MVHHRAAKLIGKLVGAHVALPAAGAVFCVAALAGVPVGTAVVRATVTGALFFLGTSFVVRLLMTFVIRDWRNAAREARKTGESREE